MPTDLSNLIESLQRGIATLPPAVLAIVLLGGPTAALVGYRVIGYRMMDAARRMQTANEVEAAPLWVCHDCRSVNELRVTRCYRCGVDRPIPGEIEFILDQPSTSPTFFEVPLGSPFAAYNTRSRVPGPGPGVPVMASPAVASDAVAVGPGRPAEAPVAPRARTIGLRRPATPSAVAPLSQEVLERRLASVIGTGEAAEPVEPSDLVPALDRNT